MRITKKFLETSSVKNVKVDEDYYNSEDIANMLIHSDIFFRLSDKNFFTDDDSIRLSLSKVKSIDVEHSNEYDCLVNVATLYNDSKVFILI